MMAMVFHHMGARFETFETRIGARFDAIEAKIERIGRHVQGIAARVFRDEGR